MGGHVAGEVASKIAVDAIEAFIGETASDDSGCTWPHPIDPTLGLDGSRLKSAFHLANRRLADEVAAAVDLRGMATTASTVLLKDDHKAMLAHVGDSRIYLFRDNELRAHDQRPLVGRGADARRPAVRRSKRGSIRGATS